MKARYKDVAIINRRYSEGVYAIEFDGVASCDDPGTLELSEADAAKLAWDLLRYLPADAVKKIKEDL